MCEQMEGSGIFLCNSSLLLHNREIINLGPGCILVTATHVSVTRGVEENKP